MQATFKRIGLVGRSKQPGLREVVEELLVLLESRELEVVLEDRLGELVADANPALLADVTQVGSLIEAGEFKLAAETAEALAGLLASSFAQTSALELAGLCQ